MAKGKTVVHVNIGERQIEDVQGIDVIVTTKDNTRILYDKWYMTEQEEPCGDLISRDAVLKEINCWIGSGEYRYAMSERFLIDRIKTLPSVNPQEPKTGHWTHDGSHWKNRFICSECGYKLFDEPTNYCPNCGCRMVEPQESEIHCNCTDAEIAKSFIEDVEAVKDLLPQESDHKCHTCKHYTSGEHDGSCDSYICENYSDWESEDKE